MKAVLCTGYGSPEVLKIADVPKPVPRKDEVLIKIQSTAVNSGDVRMRAMDVEGPLKIAVKLATGWRKPRRPILGTVYAGIIDHVGENVTSFKKGDRVFGCSPGLKCGCYAEYITQKESSPMTKMPEHASFEEAVSLLFGGTTALYFLSQAEPFQGKSILIYGASGAVGTAAVQVAKNYGLVVTAVSSAKNEELVRDLGGDIFLDYHGADFWANTMRYDMVFDAVGKLNKKQIQTLTKKEGKHVTVGAMDVAKETKAQLDQLRDWFDSGKFKAVIDRTYRLEEIKEAHAYVEKGHKAGNVVIKIP